MEMENSDVVIIDKVKIEPTWDIVDKAYFYVRNQFIGCCEQVFQDYWQNNYVKLVYDFENKSFLSRDKKKKIN